MQDRTVNQSLTCIGIDLGDQHSHYVILEPSTGEILEEGRIASTPHGFQRRFGAMEAARIAIEVGSQSPWVSRLLAEAGHEVIVANAYKLRLIYENDSKDDLVDAQYLARLAAADPELLHPIRHRSVEAQSDRALIIARDRLVGCRTKLINSMRGMAKALGRRLPRCSPTAFHNRMRREIPEELATVMTPMLDVLAFLHQKIYAFDKAIKDLCANKYPQTSRLRQIKGVGPITALDFVLKVEDPRRFAKRRSLGSYLGLRPKKRQSGKGDPELRITKAGDSMLRWHLVQSAQYMLGPFGEDCDLRRWGMKLANRGGKRAKRRAVIAVARKLACLMLSIWTSGQDYEPLRNSESLKSA